LHPIGEMKPFKLLFFVASAVEMGMPVYAGSVVCSVPCLALAKECS
jgi:hypothetical protein